MKTIKKIGYLVYSVLIQILLSPFRFLGYGVSVVEGVARVSKETITFFIKQIESEVLK